MNVENPAAGSVPGKRLVEVQRQPISLDQNESGTADAILSPA